MKKAACLTVAVMVLAVFATLAAQAVPPCWKNDRMIYQYSVATTPASHHGDFSSVVAAAEAHCANKYGSRNMGASIQLNATCTQFLVRCHVCFEGALPHWEAESYPMSLEDAVVIGGGSTNGGGVMVDVDQTLFDNGREIRPGFRIDYITDDGGTSVHVLVDAETGESTVLEARPVEKVVRPDGFERFEE